MDLDLNLGRGGPSVMLAQLLAWATRVSTRTYLLAASQVMGGSPPTEQPEPQVRFPDCRRALEFTAARGSYWPSGDGPAPLKPTRE